MPRPTTSDVHVDRPLSNVSVAFIQSAEKFVAQRAFPRLPVQRQSDQLTTYTPADFRRTVAEIRAPGTRPRQKGYGLTRATYFCDQRALEHPIADETRRNADPEVDLERAGVELLVQDLLIQQELQWSTDFFSLGVWDTDIAGVAAGPAAGEVLQWNDATATPLSDLRVGIRSMEITTGFRPNVLVLHSKVFDDLQDHTDFTDRITGGATTGDPAMVTPELIARVLRIERVVVADASYNTADENQSASNSYILGRNALLAYAAPNPGPFTPSAGYTVVWRSMPGAEGLDSPVFRGRDDLAHKDVLQVFRAYDMLPVATSLGYFFSNIVAA